MHKTKAIKLLKSLNANELKRFNKFLRSPYYHNNPHLNNLYQTVRVYAPDYQSPKLQRELVYQKLFPEEKIDLNKFRKLLTAFTQILEEYLIHLELEEQGVQKKLLLKSALGRRNVFDLFEKQTFDLIGELEQHSEHDQAYFRNNLDLYEAHYFHPLSKKTKIEPSPIGKAMDHLDMFFALSKLQLGAEMKARERIRGKKYPILFLEEVLENKEELSKRSSIFALYVDILELHEQDLSKAKFIEIKAKFRQSRSIINFSEQQKIFYSLLNFVVRQINVGKDAYHQETFELYQFGLEHQLVMENEQMTALTFMNIVVISSLQQGQWTLDFIQTHAKFLPENIREDIKTLSLAYLYFNQQSFDQAIAYLVNHQFVKDTNYLQARTLLVRCYFELFVENENDFEFLQDQLNAFEKYLRRQKTINKQKRTVLIDFVSFTRKLSVSRTQKDQLLKLKTQLQEEHKITYRKWLLEKTQQLLK